jgi:indole-3-glycerol phosphate synthase
MLHHDRRAPGSIHIAAVLTHVILVGESLMRSDNIAEKVRELVG